ncbi:MAG: hypothetical protein RR490_03525, partial [Niameybacter sp.]
MKNKKFLAMFMVAAMGLTGVQGIAADTVEVTGQSAAVFGPKDIKFKANTDFKENYDIPMIAKVGEELEVKLFYNN